MAKIEKSLLIHAPVEKIFDFMANPENLPVVWPSLREVRNVHPLPRGGGTRVSVSVDYTIPGAVLGKLAEPIVHKMNEHEAETVLANLKARMEV